VNALPGNENRSSPVTTHPAGGPLRIPIVTSEPVTRERIAVIGAGVAGLTAAYLLQRRHDVLLFEAEPRLGGHAHTHDVPTGTGTVAVDSGFIVHNERTYPNLLRLFAELGVRTQDSDMSMSVRCLGCGLEYAGGRGLAGLFPRLANLARPRYLRMLGEITRFHRHARRELAAGPAGPGDPDRTLGEFVADGGYSRYFVEHFLLPVVSCVWSAPERVSREYPARYLFAFLNHHGMLQVTGSPTWKTVTGGSRGYVERAVKNLTAVHVATPVRAVRRLADGVSVRDDADAEHHVDRVVLATHADQALALLADPTGAERDVLGAFAYSRNETWLHTDATLLPESRGAAASWNYLKPDCAGADRALVSYDMTRLMRLPSTERHVVTLGATDRVAPDAVLARMVYEHPVYTPESVAAQRRLPELAGPRTAFAGAYHGWGFHEDGCAAGVRAAAQFGAGWS
jgi:predicted NAD/FAD-binding protein